MTASLPTANRIVPFFRLHWSNRKKRPYECPKSRHNVTCEASPAGRVGAPAGKRIDLHLEPIDFKLGDMVCDANGLLKHAYG
jgi:hypothetical protein